jgi:hypothetical protein
MTVAGHRLATIPQFAGRERGVPDWLTIDQDRVDQFAA